MAYSGGSAYVQVLPSLKGFNSSIQSQLRQQLGGVGDTIGRRLGGEVSSSFGPALGGVRGHLDATARAGVASMSTLARGTAPVLDQLSRVSPVLGRMRDGFASSVVAGMPLSGMAGTLGGKLRTVVDHTSSVGAGFGRLATSAEGSFSRISSSVGRGLTAPIRQAGVMLGGLGLNLGTAFAVAGGFAVSAGIKFNASQESATMAFTTMLQSGERAKEFMGQLTTFAAKTPFELPGVTSAAQRLMAFGFEARDVIPTLTAVGDAVAGLGGSAQQVDQVTNAIGQMMAKGKVQSDEILQLTEAGIPALRILANQFGVTSGEMQDMITKGLVSSADAIPKLLGGIEQGTKGAAGTTTAFAGMMEQQSTTIKGVWSNFVDNFNKAMGNLLAPAMPAIKSGLTWLTDQIGALPGWFEGVRARAAPVFGALGEIVKNVGSFIMDSIVPALKNIWDAVQPVVVIVGGALYAAFRAAGHILSTYVGPAIVTISTWLEPLMPILVGIAAAFVTWFAIGLAISAVGKAIAFVKGIVVAFKVAWALLNLAFAVSPIGLVVALIVGLVAGIAYAWTHFAGFRDFWIGVWEWIKNAASFAWNNVIKPVFAGIAGAVQFVGGIFSWLWHTILSPIFQTLYTVISIVAGIFFTVLFAPLILVVKLVAAIFMWWWNTVLSPILGAVAALVTWLWQAIFAPAFAAIGGAISWFWNTVALPVFNALVAALQFVGNAAVWLWQSVFVPAWNAIGAVLGFVWNTFIAPIFAALKLALDVVGAAFSWIYENVIKPVWSAVGTAIKIVYDSVISPAFEALKSAVGAVGDAFSAVVEAIKTVWDTIKSIVAVPINFVIETIWNNGIRAVWNKIVGWIPGLDLTLGELSPIRLARGGVLPGYAPGRDSVHTLLSPGEAVLVPELVRMLGAENIISANRAARSGRGGAGTGPSFSADGSPRFFLGGLWDGIASVGRGIGNVAEAIGSAVADAASFIANFTDDPLGTLTSLVPGIGGLTQFANKGWGKAIVKLPGSIFGGLVSAIKRALGFEDDGQGGPPPEKAPLTNMTDFANAQQGKRYLWGATGPNNWDCSGLVGALWAIKQGKDPYKRYMTTAGMGVGKFGMQAGPGPFTVYLGPGHTAANVNGIHAEAYGGNGVPLAIGRVGTPLSYYHTIMHYALGGLVGSGRRAASFRDRGWPEPPGMTVPVLERLLSGGATEFDTGGWLPPGLSATYNGTRAPEAVLTAAQWNTLASAASGDGGTFTGTLLLDSGELLGVVQGEISRANDQTGRAIVRRTR